jgi:NAD(P)-dependent dehydrogenase (short-subunit alcohol dehydrogenase family)
LVNNAGAVFPEFELTEDGFEKTFALNYMAGFHISLLLLPALQKSDKAQILNITSKNYKQGRLEFQSFTTNTIAGFSVRFAQWLKLPLRQKILFAIMGRQLMSAYAQSKLAQVIGTKKLANQFAPLGIKVNCLHPGIVKTGIATRHASGTGVLLWRLISSVVGVAPQICAAYIMTIITRIEREPITASYIENSTILLDLRKSNFDNEKELWEWSTQQYSTKNITVRSNF